MEVDIFCNKTKSVVKAKISLLTKNELPLKKDGWQFNWNILFKIEGAFYYKICLMNSPKKVEGLLMVSLFNDEMVFMNNLESAPYNIGIKKQYENVTSCLIAYACKISFEKGISNYKGFLSFESKTALIPWYTQKYGAILAMGHKMFITPENGKKLITKFLKIKI